MKNFISVLAVFLMACLFGCAQLPPQQQDAGDTACGIVQDIQDVISTPDLLTKDELSKISETVPVISMVCKDDGTFHAVDLQTLVDQGIPLIQDRIINTSPLTPQGKALATVSLKIIERRILRVIKRQQSIPVIPATIPVAPK